MKLFENKVCGKEKNIDIGMINPPYALKASDGEKKGDKSEGKTELDAMFGQKAYSDFDISGVGSFVDAQFSERWNSRLELGHSENRETTRDKLSPDLYSFNTYRDSLNWQNSLALDDQNSLMLGLDAYEDRVRSSTDFEQDSRWNRAAFVQHRFEGEYFSTELGLRHDKNQQFGSNNTWSGSLTVPLNAAPSWSPVIRSEIVPPTLLS